MTKSKVSYFLVLCVMVLSVCGFSACTTIGSLFIDKPTVALDHVGLKDVSAMGATVLFGIQVENPNSFALKVDSIQYTADVGGHPMSTGTLADIAPVPAHGKAIVEIPVPVKFLDVFSSLLDLVQSRSTTYHVKGSASFGLISVPFEQSGDFKLDK